MKILNLFKGCASRGNMTASLYALMFNLFCTVPVLFVLWLLFTNGAGDSGIIPEAGTIWGLGTFFTDLLYNQAGGLPLALGLGLLSMLVYLGASVFLAGGIYSLFIDGDDIRFSRLLAASAENFFPMLKLALLNLVHLLLVAIVPGIGLFLFFKPGILNINQGLAPFIFAILLVITVVLLIYGAAVYDFSRILRLKNHRNFMASFAQAVGFIVRLRGTVFLLFLFYITLLAVLYLFYWLIGPLTAMLPTPLLLFVFYQLFMWVRYFFKVSLMRAETNLAEEVE